MKRSSLSIAVLAMTAAAMSTAHFAEASGSAPSESPTPYEVTEIECGEGQDTVLTHIEHIADAPITDTSVEEAVDNAVNSPAVPGSASQYEYEVDETSADTTQVEVHDIETNAIAALVELTGSDTSGWRPETIEVCFS